MPSNRVACPWRWSGHLSDADPATAGIQASCDVVLRAPGRPDQTLPACDAASPQGGPQPCWYLTSSTACGSGVLFAVNRTGAKLQPAWIGPVEDRAHLERLVPYVLDQSTHHDLRDVPHPALSRRAQ